MPGTTSAAKEVRISVAPASITLEGSTLGAVEANFFNKRLSSTDWPAARAVEDPTLKATVNDVRISSKVPKNGLIALQSRIAVVDGRSSGNA